MQSIPLYIYERTDFDRSYSRIDVNKYRRYELCLSFARTLIHDFFPAVSEPNQAPLFQTLGHIACCIDTHLDALTLSQKEELRILFPSFFDQLHDCQSDEAFSWRLSSLCQQLETSLYPPSAAQWLFWFYGYCREMNLLPELRSFSLTVIEAGINKAKANNPEDLLNCLRLEGQAAIHFLLTLLTREGVLNPSESRFGRLRQYLSNLEHMLNIADDLGDCRKDRASGIISLSVNLRYFLTLGTRLVKTFFTTIFQHPFRFSKHFLLFSYQYFMSEIGKSVNCSHARLPEGFERKTT